MSQIKINKKFIPLFVIGVILAIIWMIFMGIPLINSLIDYINEKIPSHLKLPFGLSVISIFTVAIAIYGWKITYPFVKNSVMNKYDKPSLAVVMSGSSGVGVLNAFKKITDSRFASAVKGVLFDVEKEKAVRDNSEGAIDAYRYPVQPAQSGFKGASGARDIEYDEAKNAFYKFFKPFAKKINSVARITGIGKGNTSISSTVKFDFADFKDFPGTESMTLFDFVVVERTDEDKTSIPNNQVLTNIDSVVKISGDNFLQNGIVFSDESLILTSSAFIDENNDALRKIKISTKSGKVFEARIAKIFDDSHLVLLSFEEEVFSFKWKIGNSYAGQIATTLSVDDDLKLITEEHVVNGINNKLENHLELIETKVISNSNNQIGSPLVSEKGSLLGVTIQSKTLNYFISGSSINNCINRYQEELNNKNN